MKEIKKDLFECIYDPGVDAICITTNANYSPVSGLACMGGGCAYEAARRWPEVPKRLGMLLKKFGSNIPFVIGAVDQEGAHMELRPTLVRDKQYKCLIFSFPTINNLGTGANLQLIKQSATIMADYATQMELKGIVIGRPGAGIGGLQWSEVRDAIAPILDDRFTIVSFTSEE